MEDNDGQKKPKIPELDLYKIKFGGVNDLGNKTIEWLFVGAIGFNDAVRMINDHEEETGQEIMEVHFVGVVKISLNAISKLKIMEVEDGEKI